jgi:NAD(P)-dependent dehydrogenase (short-subunit alcohol dehydrogenase family)
LEPVLNRSGERTGRARARSSAASTPIIPPAKTDTPSKDGADRVVTEITWNGGQAVAAQANVARKQLESHTPLGRTGQTQDIAPAAVFLASSDGAWITGESLVIAGGLR